jgi:quinoprotein glucose dehydrogenase
MRTFVLWIFVIAATSAQEGSWTHYGADAAGTRYSPLKQISPANVDRLKVAWTYHTGALDPKTDLNEKAAFEATPILVDGVLYLSTPYDQVIALNPATGTELWKYDPHIDRSKGYSEVSSRGVAAWGARFIFIGTLDGRLIAIEAKTGKPAWQVDLTRDVELRDRGDYQVTSPPTVYHDLVITGSSIGDNRAVDVERGIIRAYDARTGKLRWTWDPVPWAAKTSPRTGAANAWSALSVDTARGLVYVPTGSASPDFYGGLRPGDNRYANSVVALRAETGELVWGFQVVHHDVWDYDVASQPTLFTSAKGEPAVAINTKMGLLFVLNRITGKPLFPITERPVPKSNVPGEEASPTQPFPATEPLVPNSLTAADAWGATDADRNWCREKMQPLRAEGIFTPPSLQGTLAFPGNVGGVNWGSAAVDSANGILVVNTNRVSTMLKLIPREQLVNERTEAKKNRLTGEFGRQTGAPYSIYREFLLSPSKLPCNAPPWGTVTAVNLKTGKKLWETPLGSYVPGSAFGALNLGGPMITGGGLVFTAAVAEPALRGFDLKTGKEVWKADLPASAQATPMTYSVAGKQYVVICAGGHGKLGSKMGDSVVAFTLQ